MSRLRWAISVLAWAAIGARSQHVHAAPREWLVSSLAPLGSPTGDAIAAFGRLTEEASARAVKVKLRLGGILGDETDTVRLCGQGQIQVTAVSLGAVIAVVPELRALELPYLFRDVEAYQKWAAAIRDGADPTLQRLFERRGLILLGVASLGWRNIASVRKPIHSPRDLHQLRVRAQPSDLHPIIWQALGAQPKSFGLNELNSALDVDLVEAFDLPAFMLFATSMTERVRFLTLSQHVASIGVIMANADAWKSLSPQARAKIRAGMPGLLARLKRQNFELEAALVGLLAERKVQVITPTAAEMAEFKAATRSVEAYVRRTGSKQELELLDLAQRIVREGAGK